MEMNTTVNTKYNKLIIAVSIIIPLAVALLFGVNLRKLGYDVQPLNQLPPIYATINGVTAVVLVAAVVAIKNGNRKLHEYLMKFAIACSLAFLVMYVAYHMTADSVKFGDANHDYILDATEASNVGGIRYLYYFILASHIVLSIVIIPMVLFSYVRALTSQFDQHRKLARITFPIWLYVAITGVLVYILISPYYVK